jgi:cellulose synthase/poly-beta-1,6-N-acetylglucosamine synthase-like glycosyltransferase
MFQKLFGRTGLHDAFDYSVSIVIACGNEEAHISNKLNNTLSLDYHRPFQIVVALDAPTDETADIVRAYSRKYDNIQSVELMTRAGKEAAQKEALTMCEGDIIVFTDVSTQLDTPSLEHIVTNFVDPTVGGVDGMIKMINKDGTETGEGAYLKYENKIREWEANLGSTVSFGGCLFAARKEVLEDFSDCMQSDFRTALMTVTTGYQAIIDKNAIAKVPETADPSKEFARKHRTIVRGLNTFFHHLYLLNPFKYGWFSYQLLSHKLMKWLVPFFMISALVSNVYLTSTVDGPEKVFWALMQIGQGSFYMVALYGWVKQKEAIYFKLPAFFLMANAAILKAWFSYAKGERFVMWTPTKR